MPAKPPRRGVLASVAGLLALGAAQRVGAVPAGLDVLADAGLDAEFIALCAEHMVNRDAFNGAEDVFDERDHPLWVAYARTRDAISVAKPHTLEGVAAKARAAKAEAGPRGDFESGPAAAWSWQVVQDLLRLRGEA